ncbi:methyltransferase [Persicimonas caeni]|uniref:Methyltransferase n=1 Tax=Persicimonas caeni TaxID=2292766 RepID=A0A4Y6PU49_PERCE|nr:methyltransferase [Persicimonas caeni]QDG51547.1 methyltransferase [Persicimonas caeni]QED32768.1 methyltransferase [Persicimonas caeni]
MTEQAKTTRDVLGDEELTILQHERGYRFGLDALLLATDLPEMGAAPTIVELGAAQGIVSLCVARQWEEARVVAVERQDSLFGLLEQNIALNNLSERVDAVHGDVRDFRDLFDAHSADLVVCNPPYFRQGERRPSSHAQRAAARHELHGELADFVDAARYVLGQRGRLKVILPPIRLADLMHAAEGTDLTFESMRFFHSREDTDAYLVESVLRRGGAPDLKVRPPLYIYQNAHDYTEEVQRRIEQAPRPQSRTRDDATP